MGICFKLFIVSNILPVYLNASTRYLASSEARSNPDTDVVESLASGPGVELSPSILTSSDTHISTSTIFNGPSVSSSQRSEVYFPGTSPWFVGGPSGPPQISSDVLQKEKQFHTVTSSEAPLSVERSDSIRPCLQTASSLYIDHDIALLSGILKNYDVQKLSPCEANGSWLPHQLEGHEDSERRKSRRRGSPDRGLKASRERAPEVIDHVINSTQFAAEEKVKLLQATCLDLQNVRLI